MPKLQFPPDQELTYRRSVASGIIQILRIGLVAGMIAVPAFVTNDLLFDPDAVTKTLPARLGVMGVMMCGFLALFAPRIAKAPAIISAITFALFVSFAGALVLIQANHSNGFLVTVPGYVQVLIFIPIVCFSFGQAIATVLSMAMIGVMGSVAYGASEIEVMNLFNWLTGSAAFALGAAFVVDSARRRSFVLEQDLSREKARADDLLLNILPERIAERLKNKEARIADYCPNVTIVFADIVGFTALSRGLDPEKLVDLLNDLFSRFDRVADDLTIEKIKTIGDGYMAAAGLSDDRDAGQAARAAADLALAMDAAFDQFRRDHDLDLGLRIGVHSGPVIAGVIGAKKFAFDLWGDTVNVASRIESSCPVNQIQITVETRALLGDEFQLTDRGSVDVRGHDPHQVFLLGARI